MKKENTSLRHGGFWHISTSRNYMENKHVVHVTLTRTRSGCSEKDAIDVTELALDCLKDKAKERSTIDEVILRLANL